MGITKVGAFATSACVAALLATSASDSALAAQPSTAAAASPPKSIAQEVTRRDAVDMPGKEVLVETVEYPPGVSSPAHRHDAQVFVYVLQGQVVMQVQGGPRLTLGPGQTFYESPSDIHSVAANASSTEPAKILVFMIKDKGKATTRLVPASPGQ